MAENSRHQTNCYSEPISEELKALLRKDELQMWGLLPDDATVYHDEQSLRQAFQEHLHE